MSFSHTPRKRFGQNFLKDESVIQNIIACLNPNPNEHFVEIGPGLGALTKPLLSVVSYLDVIEIDRDLIENLTTLNVNSNSSTAKFSVHQADALSFDYSTLIDKGLNNQEQKLRIVGNLPYNISTPLIFHLLNYSNIIQDMHFMLQQEVVDRLTATPNHKSYGKLTIMLQYFCQATALFSVEPESFHPKPKVRSAIVRLTPFATPPYPAKNLTKLREVTTAAFNQRRKTLHNSLKAYLNDEDFEALSINPNLRAEQLTVEEFVRIANFVE